MSDNLSGQKSRRQFIGGAATVAATAITASVMPTTAEGMARIKGANDRIHIGHVGVGVQGYGAHVRLMKGKAADNNTEQIAVCDLYGRRIQEAQKEMNLTDSQTYTDFRKMMSNKNIDAVVVATSDNWHAEVAIAAMQSGKHVYIEKPMCKTVDEAFKLYDTVKSTKRTLQVGSQGCTDPKYKAVAEIVKSGKLGHPVVAQGNYMRNGRVGEWNNYGRFDVDAGPTASGVAHVDWETFRKGTQPKEYDADRFFRWRKYWEYGSGLVGDLFPHKLHPLFIALGLETTGDKGWPLRVSSGGGLYVQKVHPYLKNADGSPRIDREVPDFVNINVDFGDVSLMAMSSTINEEGWVDSIRCNKGTIFFSGNRIEVKPERTWSDEVDPSSVQAPGNGEPIDAHEKNWFDCIRSGAMPNCNIELATRVQVMISLAERAFRESKTFTFDPKTRKVSS